MLMSQFLIQAWLKDVSELRLLAAVRRYTDVTHTYKQLVIYSQMLLGSAPQCGVTIAATFVEEVIGNACRRGQPRQQPACRIVLRDS